MATGSADLGSVSSRPWEPSLDVFVHVPRSSGSTIRSIVSREYGLEQLIYFEPGSQAWLDHVGGRRSLAEQVAATGTRLITGHHPYGIHAILNRACRTFAVLRDPIDRWISEYYIGRHMAEHSLNPRIRDGLTIWQLFDCPELSPGSYISGLLAGTEASPSEGPADAAIDNIRHAFSGVVLAERFDESILLLAKALAWKVPLYRTRNVTRQSQSSMTARTRIAHVVRNRQQARFAEDYRVHDAASQLLSARVEAEGPAFDAALGAFRSMVGEISKSDPTGPYRGYTFKKVDPLPDGAERFIGSEPYRTVEAFLASPPAAPFPMRNLVGNLEKVTRHEAVGWAADLSYPKPVAVEMWNSGRVVSAGMANVFREDVRHAGHPTGHCGFCLQMPDGGIDPSEVVVRYAGTPIRLPMAQAAAR